MTLETYSRAIAVSNTLNGQSLTEQRGEIYIDLPGAVSRIREVAAAAGSGIDLSEIRRLTWEFGPKIDIYDESVHNLVTDARALAALPVSPGGTLPLLSLEEAIVAREIARRFAENIRMVPRREHVAWLDAYVSEIERLSAEVQT